MLFKKKPKTKEDFYQEISTGERIADEERRRILAVVAHLSDGLLIFDKNGSLSLINPQAEKLLGVKSKEVLAQPIIKLGRFSGIQPLVTLLGGVIKEISKKEVEMRPNFILEVSVTLMKIGEESMGSLVVLHDISKMKLVEKMKSEFVTLAAHQLRTPASAIKWTIKTLQDGDFGEMTKEQNEALQKAYILNEKVITLVADLLDVAQIEEGKYLSKMILVNIVELIQSVAADLEENAKERNIKISLRLKGEAPPKIMMDREKMKIVVENILDNAIRYTLPKGKIDVSIEAKEEEVEIQIKDTGVGIAENEQEKVFAKFYRGTNTAKFETEGNGLGLFLTKNIIEAHGGKITFKSGTDKGTTFAFTIPIKKEYGEYLTREFY